MPRGTLKSKAEQWMWRMIEKEYTYTADSELTYANKTLSVKAWSKQLKIQISAILVRLKAGCPIEKILSTANTPDRLIMFMGITQSIAEWANTLSMDSVMIIQRLNAGESIRRVLAKRKPKCTLTYKGKTMGVDEWAKKFNANPTMIYYWLKKGLPVEQIFEKVSQPPQQPVCFIKLRQSNNSNDG